MGRRYELLQRSVGQDCPHGFISSVHAMRGQRANSTAGGASGQLDAGTTACFVKHWVAAVCGHAACVDSDCCEGQGHRLE